MAARDRLVTGVLGAGEQHADGHQQQEQAHGPEQAAAGRTAVGRSGSNRPGNRRRHDPQSGRGDGERDGEHTAMLVLRWWCSLHRRVDPDPAG